TSCRRCYYRIADYAAADTRIRALSCVSEPIRFGTTRLVDRHYRPKDSGHRRRSNAHAASNERSFLFCAFILITGNPLKRIVISVLFGDHGVCAPKPPLGYPICFGGLSASTLFWTQPFLKTLRRRCGKSDGDNSGVLSCVASDRGGLQAWGWGLAHCSC